jgi:short-subunit dehydrogenase
MKLAAKSAVITGASQGLGRTIALRFAEEGANLLLCARTRPDLERTASEVRENNPSSNVAALSADV